MAILLHRLLTCMSAYFWSVYLEAAVVDHGPRLGQHARPIADQIACLPYPLPICSRRPLPAPQGVLPLLGLPPLLRTRVAAARTPKMSYACVCRHRKFKWSYFESGDTAAQSAAARHSLRQAPRLSAQACSSSRPPSHSLAAPCECNRRLVANSGHPVTSQLLAAPLPALAAMLPEHWWPPPRRSRRV